MLTATPEIINRLPPPQAVNSEKWFWESFSLFP
jgi:hypothetical protein